MAQAVADQWESPYKFHKDGVIVVLRHHLDKNIRISPNDDDKLDADGGFGKKAQWKVSVTRDNGVVTAKFANEKTGNFLRISKNGEKINAGGKGGNLCVFTVHRQSSGVVKLESVASPGSYVAVSKDGLIVGKGGGRCRIEALKQGKPEPFTKPYRFGKENTVVIEHRDDGNLRVSPKNTEEVDSEGGKGEFAQWIATPSDDGKVVQFKSVKTGDYLRIRPNGSVDAGGKGKGATYFNVHRLDAINEVRLESQKQEGKFLELDPKNKTFVGGNKENKKSIFHIFRKD